MKMNNQMIENRLKRSIEKNTPNVLPDVLQSIEAKKGGTEMDNVKDINIVREKRKTNRWVKWAASAAAVFAIAFSGYFVNSYLSPQAVVGFDVNPSVELKVNRAEKILDVSPLNQEGVDIIGDMDLKRVDLDVGVNAIVGSMVKNGYISEAKNSILISVNSKNAEKGLELQKHLSEEVDSLLSSYNLSGAILTQTVSEDERIMNLAEDYNISLGKAALIDLMVNQDSRFDYDDLAKLSINDIYLLINSKEEQPKNVNFSGQASSSEYIGVAKAKSIALDHAGVREADISKLEIEMDYDDGRMIYEVEFEVGDRDYEYDIDAITGSIIEYEIDDDHGRDQSSKKPATSSPGNTDKNSGSGTSGGTSNSQNLIGAEKAKSIAFSHAKVSAANVRDLELELDSDDGRRIYEIEFEVGNREYEYDIDAYSGKILDFEWDEDDDNDSSRKETTSPSKSETSKTATTTTTRPASTTTTKTKDYIGTEKAKSIAFSHAKVSAANVRDLEVELDSDDGRMIYEVEFEVGDMEYEYEIDAYSGKILDFEWDD